MFSVLDEASCLELIARAAGIGRRFSSREALERAYQSFLTKRFALPFPARSGTTWVNDLALERRLLGFINTESPLNDYERYADEAFLTADDRERELVAADVDHLRDLVTRFAEADPDYWRFWSLLINFVLCPRSRYSTRGGTTSDAIGVIFACSPCRYSALDNHEFLVHEATHHMVFLYELVYGLYDYPAIARQENYATAVLSGKRRPLDKVFHSIVVSTEVLLHRERTDRDLHEESRSFHGSAPTLAARTESAIESLQAMINVDELLTPAALWLLDQCRDAVGRAEAPLEPLAV